MSGRSSDQVDPFRLASQGRGLTLRLPLSALPRLGEVLLSTQGEVVARLDFRRDEAGHCVLDGNLAARVSLRCQRCLESMMHEVSHDFTTIIVATDAEAARLQQDYDVHVIENEDGRLDLPAFIEDELLLSLPIVPLHEGEAACGTPAGAVGGGPAVEVAAGDSGSAVKRPNPFAALAGLKKDGNTH